MYAIRSYYDSVGGAITAKSDPHKEYEECLIKAKAMREVFVITSYSIHYTKLYE